MIKKLTGIFAPMTTPFGKDGELDRAAFESNCKAHMQAGLNGLVIAGSTGEAAFLDATERALLVDWARKHVPSDRLVIAGVGAESTRTTLSYIDSAAKAGADAVLVVAPHYFGSQMTEAALRAHYSEIANKSRVPVMLYNIPKYMHFRLSKGFVQEFARHQNVVGIKDSSGDKDSLTEYLSAQSDTFNVITGSGQLWGTALQMGARGGILAVADFAPGLCRAIWDAVQRKDVATADALQNKLTPLAKVIVAELGNAGVKAAEDIIGLKGGMPRLPLLPVSSADVDRVRQMLRDAELQVAA